MRFAPIFLLFFFLISCQNHTVQPDTLARTWRFVGVGSHLADMIWNLDGFNYADAPTVDLRESTRVSGFTGVNRYDGNVETTVDFPHPQQLAVSGKITITALSQTQRGGTVAQVQVENQLMTGLQQARGYYVTSPYDEYHSLSVNYGGGSDYLYFISKR